MNFKEPIGTLLKSLLKCGGAWRAQVARMLQTLEQGGIRANSLSAEELLWLSTLQPGAA